MEREHRDYGVIILNYNTANDAIYAAKSVIANAGNRSYIICIVDNASTKKGEVDTLKSEKLPNTEIVALNNNCGYAKGNNEGIYILLSKYDLDYIVIMNPDVLVHIPQTIDNLVNRLEKSDKKYYGISPLIKGRDLNKDQHLNMVGFVVPSYFELLVLNTSIFKFLFYKKYKQCTYKNLIPYKSNFDAEAVQGGFFIIKTDKFRDISFFDDRTFLYGEERIIGYKVKEKGGVFLVSIDDWVQHLGGSSTKIEPKKQAPRRSMELHLASDVIYLRYYLHASNISIWIYKWIVLINFILKKTVLLLIGH